MVSRDGNGRVIEAEIGGGGGGGSSGSAGAGGGLEIQAWCFRGVRTWAGILGGEELLDLFCVKDGARLEAGRA